MLVRVLGPLEISDGGECRRLRAAKRRALLAALVVRVGSPVSVDRLIEVLWEGHQAPATAVNLVQGYVAALRHALSDQDRKVLRTQPPGYQLVLAEDELDVRRFDALSDRGRRALADGDSQVASDLLTEALSLWRGQPYADVAPIAAVEEEADRLEQLRLATLEARIDADLDLGRHAALVPELHTLTGTHSLVERFWAHLMLALYRCGRQAEAFKAFQRLHRLLDDELGIQPSKPVRELHRRILAAAPELDAHSSPRVRASADRLPLPAQLPVGSPTFVGRAGQLTELMHLLGQPADRTRVAVVSGPTGIGKTTIVLEAAHRVRSRFPDGQLFAVGAVSGMEAPTDDILARFLRDLGVEAADVPPSTAERTMLLRSICARRQLLIVIDDACSAEQVASLLPGAGGCAVVVTSRRRLNLAADLELDLGPLTSHEAYDLLVAIVGQDRLMADSTATTSVIQACAGSPLALRIVGGRLAVRPSWPISHVADLLNGAGRPSVLSWNAQSVRAALETTAGILDDDRTTRFRNLSALPVDAVDTETAEVIWRVGVAVVSRQLEELCGARLIEPAEPGLDSWHSLIGDYRR